MDGAWTVSELCQHIKSLLESDELLRTCAVKGEISNVSLASSGHLYLTLKDSASQIAGVMFQPALRRLKFKPQEGMKVIAFGRVSIFAARSQYQIVLQEIQPEGVGDLYVAFLQLKEKLEKEGLFDAARKRPIPLFPRVIGMVTSLQGAAIHDMLSIIRRRNPAIEVIVAPSLVQGADAPAALMAALRRLQTLSQVETIILSRGGGSPEELWAFNDENLAREIFRCRVPVISAVGHETDYTISDLVADCRAPTPSAAAELIAPDAENLLSNLCHLYERLRQALLGRVRHEEKVLLGLFNRPVFRVPLERVQREAQMLDTLTRRLDDYFRGFMRLAEVRQANLSEKLEALSPFAVLKRGYVLVSKNGKILASASQAERAGKVNLVFHDGQVAAVLQKGVSRVTLQESFLPEPK